MKSRPSPRPSRRVALQLGVAAGVVSLLGLTGCGFALRRAPEMPFRTLALNGFADQSSLRAELKALIQRSEGTRIVDDPLQAEAILDVLTDTKDRGRGAITTAGQIRAIIVTYRFNFRVRSASGKTLLGPSEVAVSRSISYNESQALAKEKEEEDVFRDLQSDIAGQVLRRLAAIRTL